MTVVHHPACAAFIQRAAAASACCDSTLVDDVKEALAKLKERRNGLGFRFLRQVAAKRDADNDMLVGIPASRLEGLLQQPLRVVASRSRSE